jgi:hypothetical protein
MKATKPNKLSKRMRRLLQAQVQEYVDNYQPHLGKITVEISPSGTTASVLGGPERSAGQQPSPVPGGERHGKMVR